MAELPAQFDLGDLRVDLGQQRVLRDGSDIALPKLSFEVLVALARAAPNIVSIDDLMSTVWAGLVVSPETVSQRIKLLRDALGDDARQPRYITGLRGRGYRLLPVVTTHVPDAAHAAGPAPVPAAGPAESAVPPAVAQRRRPPRRAVLIVACAVVLLAVTGVAWRVLSAGRKPVPVSAPKTEVTVTALPSRTVAVLPFNDLSLSRDNGQLALGLAEMVLQRLGSVKELLVIARSSSFAFVGQQVDAREIGRRLSARYLVEGAVQRIDDQLRVTAQVIDAESGHELRALSFDRRLNNIFELQDEIAQQVAATLEVQLTGADLKRVDRSRSTSLAVYLGYLRAQALLNHWKVADAEQAVQELEQVLKTDPSFALGYAELARARFVAQFLRNADASNLAPQLMPLVEKALVLDPRLGEAYSMRGQLELDSDPVAAEADFRRGLELAPNYGPGIEMYAEALHDNFNRPQEAVAMIERAILVDPIAPRNTYIKGLYAWDRHAIAESEQLMLHALQISPDFAPALTRLAQLRWDTGHIAEAAGFVEHAIRVEPQAPWIRENACAIYLDAEDARAAADVVKGTNSLAGRILLATYARNFHEPAPRQYEALTNTDTGYYAYWIYVETQTLQAGHLPQAIAALREQFAIPEGTEGAVIPERAEIGGRIALANWLIHNGQPAVAARLTAAMRQWTDRYAHNDGLMRAALGALDGHNEAAQTALIESLRGPHESIWWLYERDPVLAPLRTGAEYAAAIAVPRAYVAQQRQLIEQMRARGEIPRR